MRAWFLAMVLPSIALASEQGLSSACTRGDPVACEQAGLGVARGDWGAPAVASALQRYLGPSCGRGHLESCLVGLVAVRGERPVDERAERALLTGACLRGATFACFEVASLEPEHAERALNVACRLGEQRGCDLQSGKTETWHDVPLAMAGVGLQRLEAFEPVELEALAALAHAVALRSSDGALEVRVVVEPLDAASADYSACVSGGGCKQSDPNTGYETRYELVSQGLSNGDVAPGVVLSEARARAEFDAEWAASRVVGLRPDLGSDYRSAYIFVAHRDGVADVTLLGLHDDGARAEPLWKAALAGLRFTGRVGLGEPSSE